MNKMNRGIFSRRGFLLGGGAALGGLLLPACSRNRIALPPTYGSLLRLADNLTYVAHRTLLPGQALAREYNLADVTSFPATGRINPAEPGIRGYSEEYHRLQRGGFADWCLAVEGAVDRPGYYS